MHDPLSVDVDRARADPEPGGDLLRGEIGHEQLENLVFAARQARTARGDRFPTYQAIADLRVPIEGAPNGRQQILLPERLAQEVDRAGLHGANGRLQVGVATDEEDRRHDSAFAQGALKTQPITTAEAYIEHDAAVPLRVEPLKERLSRLETGSFHARPREASFHRAAQMRVVFHEPDDGGLVSTHVAVPCDSLGFEVPDRGGKGREKPRQPRPSRFAFHTSGDKVLVSEGLANLGASRAGGR